MGTFKDYVMADTGPLDIGAAIEAFRAELATPRPLRPQIILVRSPQEAARMAAMINEARSCRAEIQEIHRQHRKGEEV